MSQRSYEHTKSTRFFRHLSQHWLPSDVEFTTTETIRSSVAEANGDETAIPPGPGAGTRTAGTSPTSGASMEAGDPTTPGPTRRRRKVTNRSWRRRAFLLLTEPHTSILSALFYGFTIIVILISNIFEIMQTVESWQFTPTDCVMCGGDVLYFFDERANQADQMAADEDSGVECVCPPAPLPFSEHLVTYLLYFLTAEWGLRVLLFSPAEHADTFLGRVRQYLQFLFSLSTIIDAMAIFPYYFDRLPNGLISLRLLRLFRIFQFVKFGKYNAMFTSLTNVLGQLLHYLKLLILVLAFSAAFFGSMLFWLERGTWKYFEPNGQYMYVRLGVDGVSEEASPFNSIPNGLWWFMVTATTVGYGDYYPTSTAGRWCATLAMLIGILVVAFPVSVFSDLWSQELKRAKAAELREKARKRSKAMRTTRSRDGSEDSDRPLQEEGRVGESTSSLRSSLRSSSPSLRRVVSRRRQQKEEAPRAPSPIQQIMEDGESGDDDSDDDSLQPVTDLNEDQDAPHIVMDREDLYEIHQCLHSIRSNERRVQALLRKYKIGGEC